MVSTLIITQGGLARELLAAVERIAGKLPSLTALSLSWDDDLETASRRILEESSRLSRAGGCLVLVDMLGSTPANAALAVAEQGHLEVVTGVNLPMLLCLACNVECPGTVSEAARWLETKARRSIGRAERNARSSERPCRSEVEQGSHNDD